MLVGFWVISIFLPTVTSSGATYYLRAGTSKKQLINDLYQQGIISHPVFFKLYIYSQKKAHLKTGEYLFNKGASPYSIWQQVITGTGFVLHPFTIVPGWSFADLRQALATSELKPVTAPLTNTEIMAQLGYPQMSPEGVFFPETYHYTRDVPDTVVLKQAFELMKQHLNDAWEKRDPNLPYQDAYAALTAASLIEKEAYLPEEQPIIAGVLVNRLRANMLLQFDPTVIYGLGKRYTGKIRKEDLLDDNPYNTYIYHGLPPTPIAMPGMGAIEAAVHPIQHHYYYFVARGDGSHQFSKNLNDHKEAVEKSAQAQAQTDSLNDGKWRFYLHKPFKSN